MTTTGIKASRLLPVSVFCSYLGIKKNQISHYDALLLGRHYEKYCTAYAAFLLA